jgi:hypothetical protein
LIGCVVLFPLVGLMTIIAGFMGSLASFAMAFGVSWGLWLSTTAAYVTAFFMFLLS